VTVIDTSGVVDLLLGIGASEDVQRLVEREGTLSAPDVLVFEVLAVLRRQVQRDGIDALRAERALDDLADLRVELFPAMTLRGRAWQLRENFTAADALFVALAEALDEPLATKDGRLAAGAEQAGVEVIDL
jgi:predicted nucleic acid-binding protein